MMIGKLWIVIYILGKIGGVVGPLPYAEIECGKRIAKIHASLKDEPPLIVHPKDVRFACERHISRPKIER